MLSAQQSAVIAYTGSTYGYLRNDDQELTNPKSLSRAFLTSYDGVRSINPQTILVGTGNNFAPEYGARTKNGKPLQRDHPNLADNAAVDFFREHYDAIVPGQLDFYFGAEYLRQIAADPELPLLGANLIITQAHTTPPAQPLCAPAQLLLPTQVSLPIQAGSTQGGKGKGGSGSGSAGGAAGGSGGGGKGKGGSAQGQGGTGQTQVCVQAAQPSSTAQVGNRPASQPITLISPTPSEIFSWTTEFEFSVPSADISSAELCPERELSTPQLASCLQLEQSDTPRSDGRRPGSTIYRFDISLSDLPLTPFQQANGNITMTLRDVPSSKSGTFQRPALYPGSSSNLCINSVTLGHICTLLHVTRPLVPKLWIQIERQGVQYVLFGIVDPTTEASISQENLSWDVGNQIGYKVHVLDPDAPLEQLIRVFERRVCQGKSDSECRQALDQWNVILLAQMPSASARTLASVLAARHYRLTSLISAADEYTYIPYANSELQSSTDISSPLLCHMDPATGKKNCDVNMLVPAPTFTPQPITREIRRIPDQQLTPIAVNPLQVIETTPHSNAGKHYVSYLNRAVDTTGAAFIDACGNESNIFRPTIQALDSLAAQRLPPPRAGLICNQASPFECLTLAAMRDVFEADAAMLQRRDFYTGCMYGEDFTALQAPTPVPAAIREAVDRTLWNSAFLTRASVSGATLRSILQASEAVAVANQSSTSRPLQPGGDLLMLGITQANGTYYVNGVAIDDSKIYSIATVDQLALGDAEYPQFAQIDLTSPNVFIGADKITFRPADLAKAALGLGSAIALTRQLVIAQAPLPAPTRALGSGNLIATNPLVHAGSVEVSTQNRNLWSMTLQQGAAGYAFSNPNQTDASIGQNFSGVTNPNVASPHTQSLSGSDIFRLNFQWTAYASLGADQQLSFMRTKQGAITPPSGPVVTTTTGAPLPTQTVSLSGNTAIVSPFVELQKHRYQAHWKLALRPATFSVDVLPNTQFLKSASKTEVYELTVQRQKGLAQSIGVRYEHDNLNYFEAGYIHQNSMHIVSSLTINGVTTPLTASTTLQSISQGFTPNPNDPLATAGYKSYMQDGGYWLGLLTKPLWPRSKVVYQGITFGNFFAYGSNGTPSILTRYAVEVGNSLQVPIWGNLAISPAYNIFFFQDQSHATGNSLVRRDLLLQLNYQFDWHQGLAWGETLKGKSN